MTTFSDILCNYVASVYTDDIRWKQELKTNPALFFREKSLYVISGVSRFNRPPEMQAYLSFARPDYDDFYFTATEDMPSPVTIQTGLPGFELCSIGLVSANAFGNPVYESINGMYNDETGEVVLNTNLTAGQTVQIDLYTDGEFDNPLSDRQKRILGLCVAFDWFCNFTSTYLNLQPKITDKNYNVKSENEGIRVSTDRRRLMQRELDSELRSYEQDMAYTSTMPKNMRLNI